MDARGTAVELRDALTRLPTRDTPSARAVRRQFSRRLRTAPPTTVLRVASQLAGGGDGIERFVAYELIACHPTARTLLNTARLHALAGRLDSWGAVDSFACILAGPAWRDGLISAGDVRRWARSPDRWWRRAALVSTVPLNSRNSGAGDAKRTLAICAMLVRDRDDMVVKAMSWALRALGTRDPSAVAKFMSERSDVLAARVRREVQTKLRTGRKTPDRPGSGGLPKRPERHAGSRRE